MTDRITSNLAREAILAAIRDQTEAAQRVRADAAEMFESALTGTDLGRKGAEVDASHDAGTLTGSVREVDALVRSAEPDQMAEDLLSGDIQGFHEVASRINRARISFDFAMEVRNKLIDAYRETMRMTV